MPNSQPWRRTRASRGVSASNSGGMTPQGLPVMVSVRPMCEFQLPRMELKGRQGITSRNCLLIHCRGHLKEGCAQGPVVSSSDLPQ